MHIRRGAIFLDCLQRGCANRANALFAAFSKNAHGLGVKIDLFYIERGQFTQAQSTAVKKLHDRENRPAYIASTAFDFVRGTRPVPADKPSVFAGRRFVRPRDKAKTLPRDCLSSPRRWCLLSCRAETPVRLGPKIAAPVSRSCN